MPFKSKAQQGFMFSRMPDAVKAPQYAMKNSVHEPQIGLPKLAGANGEIAPKASALPKPMKSPWLNMSSKKGETPNGNF